VPANSISRRRRRQAGQALPLIGLLLVLLIGFAGLVVDGGQLAMQYRASQNAADAASLAAATMVMNGSTEAQATARANVVAQYNQIPVADLSVAYYGSNGIATTVAALVTQVTATVSHQFPTLFLPIIGIDSATVSASATASVTQGNACVLCVMGNNNTTLKVGNGNVTVTGGNIVVNSSSQSALGVGPNGSITDSSGPTYLVGNDSGANLNNIHSQVITGVPPVPDPFASVPDPVVTGTRTCCSGGGTVTINPGIYSSINLSGHQNVVMNPGVYVITGGITATGNASLTGHDVMIYLACSHYPNSCASGGESGASFTVSGNDTINISAPSYGTYHGMVLFADRHNTSGITLGGNGSTRFVGSIYDLSGNVTISGNGSGSNVNSKVVANQVTMNGNNGAIAINYTQSANYVVPNNLTLSN
jgi:Flp pilus assembly protein TadG